MKKLISGYIQIIVGIVLTAFSVSVFYNPNKIVCGGVSGISTILYHTFGIEMGVSFAVINAILLIVSYKFLGAKFVLKTLIGSALLSLFVQLFSYLPSITDNIALATLFGSAINGFGMGMVLINGSTTGGTDILGRLVQKVYPHLEIGRVLLVVDSIVILFSLAVFKNLELVMWGIVSLYVATFSINWLIRRLNVSKLAFVITNKGASVAEKLVFSSPRGVTIIDSVGAYTKKNNKLLICALKEKELGDFQNKVALIDKSAFIIYLEAQSVFGNGFHIYR